MAHVPPIFSALSSYKLPIYITLTSYTLPIYTAITSCTHFYLITHTSHTLPIHTRLYRTSPIHTRFASHPLPIYTSLTSHMLLIHATLTSHTLIIYTTLTSMYYFQLPRTYISCILHLLPTPHWPSPHPTLPQPLLRNWEPLPHHHPHLSTPLSLTFQLLLLISHLLILLIYVCGNHWILS